MDKATSTSPLEDSASAAATTKTTSASAGVSVDVSPTSVKLLIKASNQQFDDQIIESDLMWTVRRLKTQLSLVYPSKPPVDDQKLIYSGQLLQDTLLLKDVIRSYKDVYTQNHIFHLVCTQRNISPPLKPKVNATGPTNMGTMADGLRQRHGANSRQTQTSQEVYYQPQQQQQQLRQQQQQQYIAQYATVPSHFMPHWQPCPNSNGPSGNDGINNSALPLHFPSQFNIQAMATQQAAMYNWMQHVYSQYMEQCVRVSNNFPSVSPADTTDWNGVSSNDSNGSASSSAFLAHPFMQQLPFLTTHANMPRASPVIPAFPPSAVATDAVHAVPTEQPEDAQHQQAPPAPVQLPQQQQVAAPRFPNIVQVEQDNRDWFDSFLSITRLALFVTILYFNSSPLRCLLVGMIASVIYCYHNRIIRFRRERNNNNNNINRDNNVAVANQIRLGVEQVQAAQLQQQQPEGEGDAVNPPNPALAIRSPGATNNTSNEEQAAGNNDQAQDNNSNSVISFVRTFVVTFFTSLLPETPAI